MAFIEKVFDTDYTNRLVNLNLVRTFELIISTDINTGFMFDIKFYFSENDSYTWEFTTEDNARNQYYKVRDAARR